MIGIGTSTSWIDVAMITDQKSVACAIEQNITITAMPVSLTNRLQRDENQCAHLIISLHLAKSLPMSLTLPFKKSILASTGNVWSGKVSPSSQVLLLILQLVCAPIW